MFDDTPIIGPCAGCIYAGWFYPPGDNDDDPGAVLCRVPEDHLPLSARGAAMREHTPVSSDDTRTCPMHTPARRTSKSNTH